MSRKRKRDRSDLDVDLVEIYEQLASEETGLRIKAAHQLLTKVYRPDVTTVEQIQSILTRLFRGLCSGRKAARLGFAVALTELLAQVVSSRPKATTSTITTAQVIDILESQTVAEGGTRGQDERDHYFGRLFGAEAIIKSGILFTTSDRTQWNRLLNSLCSLSEKKPWLRQECGWILYQFAASPPSQTTQPFVEDIFKTLISRNLIRTPEGVTIWLIAKEKYPQANLSDHAWRHKHPLARKDIKSLAEILKNARSERLESDHEVQGAAIWSSNLHFAWEVVLTHFYNPGRHDWSHDWSFKEFWQVVVDEGLFAEKSSPERKLWGMLVWSVVLTGAPLNFLPEVFTRSALHCLITALHGQDRYLRKTAQGVLDALKQRFRAPVPKSSTEVIGACLAQLIRSTDFADFDKLTKSNAVSELLDNEDDSVQRCSFLALSMLLNSIEDLDTKKAHLRHRYVIELESKILKTTLKHEMSSFKKGDPLTMFIFTDWLTHLHKSRSFSIDTRNFLQDRLATGFEQTLRFGSRGRKLLTDVLCSPDWQSSEDDTVLQFDDRVRSKIDNGFGMLKKLRKHQKHSATAIGQTTSDDKKLPSLVEGLMLLYATALFEAFCGEAEAVEMLDDLLTRDTSLIISESPDAAELSQTCDSLVETMLSLASLSSKFLRAAVTQIFESISSKLSEEGIASLARVLTAKENAQGQQEMFEAADAEDEQLNGSVDSPSDSGATDLASDVEMVNGTDDDLESSDASDSSAESEAQSDEDDAAAAEELAAFDAALASALGTRKSNDNDPNASSEASSDDSDMSDSQMLALDEKLAAVFRARKNASSSKQTRKATKENMVTFKNRVLDLVDVYLKQQFLNPVSLRLILPLLAAIRITQTKQLSDRLCNVLREYCGRCKGQNIPTLSHPSASQPSDTNSTIEKTLSQLRAVHEEACLDTSNAHSATASQASILLVKVLIRAADDEQSTIIKEAITIYSETRMKQLLDKHCRVQPSFFTDWNNWCANVRSSLAI